MPNSVTLDFEDETIGLKAQFIADRDHPGIIEIVIPHGMLIRPPTLEERMALEAHPMFVQVQADLILEASKSWPSEWGQYGEILMQNASLAFASQAAEA